MLPTTPHFSTRAASLAPSILLDPVPALSKTQQIQDI